MRCRLISIDTKQLRIKAQRNKTKPQYGPSLHLSSTPAFTKANTTDTPTAPAANQRTERRPQLTARARSSPASRMMSQLAPSKQYAAIAQKPMKTENQI